jgi:hypothetical protein
MILFIEIALTISAWRKGWGGWALLPGGIALVLGALLGLAMGPTATTGDLIVPLLMIDGLAIFALIGMVVKGPEKREEDTPKEALPEPAPTLGKTTYGW